MRFVIDRYSKVAAEKQAWAFMEREAPSFDLVFQLAPSILGRTIEQNWRSNKANMGGQGSLYRSLFDVDSPKLLFPYVMDIDDVAEMHVRSLDTNAVPGNKRYIGASGVADGYEIARKIREEYPELRNRVPEASGSGLPKVLFKFDMSETDAVFGKNWKSVWESAKATVEDIITTEKKTGESPSGQ
jgi:hypothetical protein